VWKCPKCRSRVDDGFEVCWSCGTTPDGEENPEFLTADETQAIVDPAEGGYEAPDDSLEDFAGVPIPDLVVCYKAANVVEAKFVADRLHEAGIPAVADTHDMNLVLGGFQPRVWGYGPGVRVVPKDLPRALAWVEDYQARRKGPR